MTVWIVYEVRRVRSISGRYHEEDGPTFGVFSTEDKAVQRLEDLKEVHGCEVAFSEVELDQLY